MIFERQFFIDDLSEGQKFIDEVRGDPHFSSAKALLIKGYSAKFSSRTSLFLHEKIRKSLPESQFFGLALNNRKDEFAEHLGIVNVLFFDHSKVTVLEADCTGRSYEEVAAELGRQVDLIPDVKAVELVSSAVEHGFNKFIEKISEGREEICFFGAEAGFTNLETNALAGSYDTIFNKDLKESRERYVCGNNAIYKNGIVMLVYSGKKLSVYADAFLGWQAVGKELTITKMASPNCVETIDDMPAADIYKHYLNVQSDENMLRNICEFPLITRRNGFETARIPPMCDEKKRLYFPADVHEGEKYQLSYAIVNDMLKLAEIHSSRMKSFAPETISLYVCANRSLFLKEEEAQEIGYYKEISPACVNVMGGSELYRYHNKGGVLNSMLVAVGMSETENYNYEYCVNEIFNAEHADFYKKNEAKTASSVIGVTEMDAPTIPLTERMGVFLHEITADLENAIKTANKANQVKSQFLSSMSHEIRTPINTILGMNEMILRECRDKTIEGYADSIKRAGGALLGLINDILDFSKIEAGKLEIIEAEYALSSLINDLNVLLRYRAEEKNLNFEIDIQPEIPSVLKGDELRIRQVLTNFLTNAIKYTKEGTVLLKAEIADRNENEVSIKFIVKDTGIGIKQEDLPKLTQAFERIEEQRNRTIEGTGLGMNIASSLLMAMHSRMQVKSEYGKGSEFSFVLKQKIINDAPVGSYSWKNGSSESLKKYHQSFEAPEAEILLVDDTAMNLTVILGLLKQTKVRIDTAQSGPEALEHIRKKHYHLIFLDHRMPGMDGIETLHFIKKMKEFKARPMPVIALTANAVSGARQTYIDAGFDDYLTKPVDPEALESVIIKYLPPALVTLVDSKENTQSGDDSADAWIKELRRLDVAAGISNCGSVSAYLTALRIFYESILSGVKELDGYLRNCDLKNFTIKVHALKSSARIIGADELSDRARRLEDAGNKGYLDEIKQDYPDLRDLYLEYTDILKKLDENSLKEKQESLSSEDLKDAIMNLKQAVADYDFDSMSMLAESLDEYELPENVKVTFDRFKQAAGQLDWVAMAEIIEEMQ